MKTKEQERQELIDYIQKSLANSMKGFIGTANNISNITSILSTAGSSMSQIFANFTITPLLHYNEVKSYVDNNDDDKLIELLGNDEYYPAILWFRDIVSEKVLGAIELIEVLEK